MFLWSLNSGRGTVPQTGLDSMSIALDTKKSVFGVNSCYSFIFGTYIITDFITKYAVTLLQIRVKCLSQNASGFSLQNEAALSGSPTVITKCNKVVTKCDVYYKMHLYTQLLSFHVFTFF